MSSGTAINFPQLWSTIHVIGSGGSIRPPTATGRSPLDSAHIVLRVTDLFGPLFTEGTDANKQDLSFKSFEKHLQL